MSPGVRGSSLFKEKQINRLPNKRDNYYGIDTIVKDLQAHCITPSNAGQMPTFNGIPSPDNPPKIIDNGPSHEFSHPSFSPSTGSSTERLVATLFYKTNEKRKLTASPSPQKVPSGDSQVSEFSLPTSIAPSSSPETFPLELSAPEPERHDKIYGSYVSPMCIASFISLMSTFLLSAGSTELHSSHRCLGLDRKATSSAAASSTSLGRSSCNGNHHPKVVELTLSPVPAGDYLPLADLRKHELIYRFEREWNVDVVLQRDTLWRRHPRLVVFDMDSTLITQEVIDLLAERIVDPTRPGLGAQVADITHRAMLGELEFDAAFHERVRLLEGVPARLLTDLRSVLDVTNGVRPLLRALKRLGIKTAVLSGGFRLVTEWLASELGIDHAHANEVEVDASTGLLTGRVLGRIVGRERKRELLVEIAATEGVALEQVVAVGDGANDLLMLGTAGLGCAWHAKPRVQMEAAARLNGESLLDLLYLFGFTDEENDLLTAE